MYDYSLESLLMAGFSIICVIVFTVWFGVWIDNNLDEVLNLNQNHDEHEDFLEP